MARVFWFLPHFALVVWLSACHKTPVTGKEVFILTTEAEEQKLGTEAYRQILAKSTLSKDARRKEMLRRVGRRIAHVADRPDFKWEFALIESEEKNAFCLPGGKIAFYTGILKEMKNEAQVAAVMGHEVGHATARHAGQRMTLQFGEQLTFAALSELIQMDSSTGKTLLLQALGVGATVGATLPFSRSHEDEADHIGIIYMAMAGYEPAEAVAFWETFGKQPSLLPEWLSTHPASDNRAEHLKALLPQAGEKYSASPQYGAGETLQ